MRFAHINARDEHLWRWFRFRDTDFEVELKLVTRDELQELTANGKVEGFSNAIAEKAFRAFRGAVDAEGDPLENTLPIRKAILQDMDVWNFVQSKLLAASNWRDEGKGASGSGSSAGPSPS